MFLYKMVFFQCDHPGCMGVLRATAQKQEQQRMATLEILQVRIDDLYQRCCRGGLLSNRI